MLKLPFRVIAFLLLTLPISSQANATCEQKTLHVRGLDRTETLCSPSNVTVPVPVLLVFHGRGGSGRDIADGTRFHEVWPEALVVYLDGLPGIPAPYDKGGQYPGWQLNPGEANDRDVEFVDAVFVDLEKHFKIDKHRVFATGHSNGSRFLAVLWTMRAQRFSGFAFSASQAGNLMRAADPKPVFMGMGMRDELIPFAFQQESIKYACDLLGMDPVQFEHEGVSRNKNKDGVELMIFIHSGGHRWPAEQTRMIVDFFKRQI